MTTDGANEQNEVEELRQQNAAASTGRAKRWGRGAGAVILLVIAGLLLPSAVTAVWANRLISSTDRYVQTVSPLAEDPVLQANITDRITTEIQKYVDVQDLTEQALTALGSNGPLDGRIAEQLKALSPAIAGGVNGFVHDQVAKIVSSPQFVQAWDAANRAGHKQLVTALTGKDEGAVKVGTDGTVSIDLGELIATVKAQLVANGFTIANAIPQVDAQFVLFQSDDLSKAQSAFRALNTMSWLLPLLVILLFIGAVFLAPSRRIGVLGVGVTAIVAMVVALIALSVGRIIYLDQLPPDVMPNGLAGTTFDILTRFLQQGLRTILFFGLVTAAVALLAGPSRGAVAIRGWWVGGLGAANHWVRSIGVPTQPAAGWVESNALLLRIILVVVGVGVLLLWDYPTPKVAIWLTLAVVVGLAIIDFLRAPVTSAEKRKQAAAAT